MTSINSPACLLARNHFYRHLSPNPEQMKPVFNRQKKSEQQKQRQITLWVTMTVPSEFPGGAGTKGFCVNIILGSLPSHLSNSKQSSPAERGIK